MARVRARGVAPWLLAGLLALGTVGSQAQTTSAPATGTSKIDPALRRRGDLIRLINQAKEDLLFNNNPEAAKQKCLEALAIDPENPDARFFLAQTERQLKLKSAAGPRSPISSLPGADNLQDAVVRARVTAARDRTATATMPTSPLLRTAVVGERSGYVPPRPTPVWLSQQYLMWGAVILLAAILILILVMVYDRLLAGKRQRMAQAEFFEQMQAVAAKQMFESPVGESSLTEMPDDDFPIGASVPREQPALPAPAGPRVAEDAEVDYWEEEKPKAGSSAPAAAAVSPPPSPPKAVEEEPEIIPAGKAFGDEAFEFGPNIQRSKGARSGSQRQAGDVAASVPPVEAGPARASAAGRPVSAPPPPEDAGEPVALEGLFVQTPTIRDFDELPAESRGESYDMHAPSIEELPFMLDAPLERTETIVDQGEASPLPAMDPNPPEEVASVRLDDDFPIAANAEAPAGSLMDRSEAPGGFRAAGASYEERSAELPSDLHDEIVISPGPRKMPDETVHLAAGEIASESTMIDNQARHKAVFQDQLARGLASLEKGNYKDAIKFLSVAHAMDPTDDYARNKLHEAHEKRGSEDS